MNKFVYLNYYSDSNAKRKAEIIYCLNKNLNLIFVKKIFCFIESKKEINDLIHLNNFKKLTFIITNKRRILTIDLLKHANKFLKKNSIAIFMSSDIFLQNSSYWKNVHSNFFNKGYSYKILIGIRKNLFATQISNRQLDWEAKSSVEGDYFDVLAVKLPLRKSLLKENFRFIWGSANCDGLIMGLFTKHYHVFSWGSKYKSFHYDVVNKKKKIPSILLITLKLEKILKLGRY